MRCVPVLPVSLLAVLLTACGQQPVEKVGAPLDAGQCQQHQQRFVRGIAPVALGAPQPFEQGHGLVCVQHGPATNSGLCQG